MRTSFLLLVVLLLVVSFRNANVLTQTASPSDSSNWPMFRHNPGHTGYTESPAPSTMALVWSYTTGGHVFSSSPAVADGMVFIGSDDGKVYALNQSKGSMIWTFATGGDDVSSSSAVADGMVFVGSRDGFYSLKQSTGAMIWVFNESVSTSSPAVADGMVFIGADSGIFYALGEFTGAKRWISGTPGGVFSSPAVADGMVFIGGWDWKVHAIDQSTGATIWKYTTGGFVRSAPAVSNDMVFIGSLDGDVYAFNQSTGALIWQYTTGGWVESSPAVADGMVFIGSDDGKVYALKETTGAEIWNYTTRGPVRSSPAVADGMVFIGSSDWKFYALNQSTGDLIWEYTTGGAVESSPAVADGMVFVGSYDRKVYAFGTHDIAVTSVMAPSSATIGDLVTINVTVANKGHFNETFHLSASSDGTIFQDQQVTNLTARNSAMLSFIWNTSDATAGNYMIDASAGTVPGEDDTADNIGKPTSIVLAKAGSTITLSLSPVNTTVEGSVVIQGSISPARAGATLTIQHRPSMGEWSTLATLTTDAIGAYTYTWTPGAVGIYEIKASWPGDASTLQGESSIKTVTVVKASSSLRISISPTTVDAGSDVTIQGSISPVRATVTVTVHYRPSGGSWSTLGTAITDAAGSYAYTWTPEVIGTYEIKALWEGDAQTLADESDEMTLTVIIASSTLAITASPTTVTMGDNVVLTGSISPVRVGATITIQYRPSGGNWGTLTTVTTDTAGSYTYT